MTEIKPDPYYPFETPWHAEAFALAVHLNEKGHFTWVEWSNILGKNLKITKQKTIEEFTSDTAVTFQLRKNQKNDFKQESIGGDHYYQVWLQTLIEIMQEREVFDDKTFSAIRDQWVNAYIKTPHGEPVRI